MANQDSEHDPLINTVIAGRYEIFAKLGEGGMGAVYAARQSPLGRTVALKVLLRQLTDDAIAVKRFEKEALVISRLAHPNTVTIFDFGQTEQGLMFIAMEYLEGQTLREVIEADAPLPDRRVVRILAQMVRALSEAHQRDVIHRDLKPDNIMLVPTAGEPDFVKVLDFGVAKLRRTAGVDIKTLTQGDVIFGTPRYMAPEQVHGNMNEPCSDLYALGAIAYEMLCGSPPFDGDTSIQILMAHVQQQPQPFANLPRPVDVSEALEHLVFKLLAKRPEDRYADADAVLTAMDEIPGIGGGLRPPSGRTEGVLRPLLTPDESPKAETEMMGSNFTPVQATTPTHLPLNQQMAESGLADTDPVVSSGPLVDDQAITEPPHRVKNDTVTADLTAQPRPGKVSVPGSRRGLWLGLGAVGLVVIATLAWWITSRPPAGDRDEGNIAIPMRGVTLSITTKPRGAKIYIDGTLVGEAPLRSEVSAGRNHKVVAEAAGYATDSTERSWETDAHVDMVLTRLSDAGAAVDASEQGAVTARPVRRNVRRPVKRPVVKKGDPRRVDAGVAKVPPPVTKKDPVKEDLKEPQVGEKWNTDLKEF